MKAALTLLVIACLLLVGLCLYLWSEVERNADLAEQWASQAGYEAGRVEVLEQAKAELIDVWLRVAYESGLKKGSGK